MEDEQEKYIDTEDGKELFFRISTWGDDGEIIVEMNREAAAWFRKHFNNDFEELAGE